MSVFLVSLVENLRVVIACDLCNEWCHGIEAYTDLPAAIIDHIIAIQADLTSQVSALAAEVRELRSTIPTSSSGAQGATPCNPAQLQATSCNPCDPEGGNGILSDVMAVLLGSDIEDK
ncbi:hypothetical protein E2C01_056015 [Portunus trituberculatus]|uniref:Uncharacterized protein n=1 Tax=Portunus trituberculatus TaxID=210409 RepID=A0A5B7GYH9_PORTR|nr:hypothetical protein [Portunus trituberculatus]